MARKTGRAEVARYFASAPDAIRKRILIPAARKAVNVVADEARLRCESEEVAASIKTRVRTQPDGTILARVETRGKGAYIAPWLEHGTSEHFISVSDADRQGMSVSKVNREVKKGSLVINGQFVGGTVLHPGARPHPFLRPALDVKEGEAIAAAQAEIDTRATRYGLAGPEEPEGVEQ